MQGAGPTRGRINRRAYALLGEGRLGIGELGIWKLEDGNRGVDDPDLGVEATLLRGCKAGRCLWEMGDGNSEEFPPSTPRMNATLDERITILLLTNNTTQK